MDVVDIIVYSLLGIGIIYCLWTLPKPIILSRKEYNALKAKENQIKRRNERGKEKY